MVSVTGALPHRLSAKRLDTQAPEINTDKNVPKDAS